MKINKKLYLNFANLIIKPTFSNICVSFTNDKGDLLIKKNALQTNQLPIAENYGR